MTKQTKEKEALAILEIMKLKRLSGALTDDEADSMKVTLSLSLLCGNKGTVEQRIELAIAIKYYIRMWGNTQAINLLLSALDKNISLKEALFELCKSCDKGIDLAEKQLRSAANNFDFTHTCLFEKEIDKGDDK